jgi:hypothetical protein
MSESLLIIITVVVAVVGVVSNSYKPESKQSEDEKSEMKEQKKRFITLIFFGTTNNYQNNLNPYDCVTGFTANSVGTLNWGTDADIRRESKQRFAYTFHRILSKCYDIHIHAPTVEGIISDDNTMLKDAIDRIVEKAAFPPI